MMLHKTIDIQRPLLEVFALAGDPNNDPRWGDLVTASRQLQPGPLQVGMQLEQTATVMGATVTTTLEVTRFEPNTAVCYRASHPIPLEHCRTFESIPGGTRLSFWIRLDTTGHLAFGSALFRKVGERRMERDLDALKELLERLPSEGEQPPVYSL